jgi:hypothetical protein
MLGNIQQALEMAIERFGFFGQRPPNGVSQLVDLFRFDFDFIPCTEMDQGSERFP